MKKVSLLLTGLVCLISFTACGPKAPSGMPKTIPCSITVMEGDKPVSEAQIILYSEDAGSVTICGTTDTSGKANISTLMSTFVGKGAPAGTYKVTVNKEPPINHTKTPAEREAMTPPQAEAYEKAIQKARASQPRIVPVIYNKKETTPITVTVDSSSAGKELAKIDIAEKKGK